MGTREVINPPDLWKSTGRSYSHVVKITNPTAMIFVAGLAGVNNDLAVVSDDIEEQTGDDVNDYLKRIPGVTFE